MRIDSHADLLAGRTIIKVGARPRSEIGELRKEG